MSSRRIVIPNFFLSLLTQIGTVISFIVCIFSLFNWQKNKSFIRTLCMMVLQLKRPDIFTVQNIVKKSTGLSLDLWNFLRPIVFLDVIKNQCIRTIRTQLMNWLWHWKKIFRPCYTWHIFKEYSSMCGDIFRELCENTITIVLTT